MLYFFATATPSVDPLNPATWIQGGLVVVVAMTILTMFLKGIVVPGSRYDDLQRRCDEMAKENQAIHQRLEGEVFDTLKATAIALANSNELVRGTLTQRRRAGQ